MLSMKNKTFSGKQHFLTSFSISLVFGSIISITNRSTMLVVALSERLMYVFSTHLSTIVY